MRVLAASAILGVALVLAAYAGAEPARFIPWADASAPPLALDDLAGTLRTLDDYRGRVVLLNFWATWCEPCRDELASMRKLSEKMTGRPFLVLLVNYGETRARVADFVKREAIAFPTLLDPNQKTPGAWRVRVLPSSFLIGPDGRVRYSVIGEIDWASQPAVEMAKRLLH